MASTTTQDMKMAQSQDEMVPSFIEYASILNNSDAIPAKRKRHVHRQARPLELRLPGNERANWRIQVELN
ncbi:hypothetical protein CU103_19715 [Phyllobacterium sophorae]|uniref:Uncharacterized protein n=1 Tax=Phyllobacterium sophorae TaxID=1520277 RepID=A0A2P7B6J2_9HYPH|nr:hypothetical protein CU103_19715 [Phyllobacterium sophorae]